jgi:hypothetical protein
MSSQPEPLVQHDSQRIGGDVLVKLVKGSIDLSHDLKVSLALHGVDVVLIDFLPQMTDNRSRQKVSRDVSSRCFSATVVP